MKLQNVLTACSLLLTALTAAPALAASELATAHLVVDGMVTPNCPVLAKTALNQVQGVESVEASVETKRITVRYRADIVSPGRFVEVLHDQVGFDARLAETAQFAIEGMATPNCPVLVKTAVGRLPGVLEVDADLESMSATVVFLADLLSADRIAATIADQVGLQATRVAGE